MDPLWINRLWISQLWINKTAAIALRHLALREVMRMFYHSYPQPVPRRYLIFNQM